MTTRQTPAILVLSLLLSGDLWAQPSGSTPAGDPRSRVRLPPGHRNVSELLSRRQIVRLSAAERGAGLRGLAAFGQRAGGVKIASDLAVLSADPTGRDPTRPEAYARMTRFVATRLQEQGVLPAGDGKRGSARYLQRFAWDQRYETGRAVSDNVIGIRRGDGTSNEVVIVVAHLDGLSAAEKRWYERDARQPRSMAGYQGTNDNASAVAAALYLSDALGRLERMRKRPLKRDVVFLFPSAEEEGLKGTEAFAKLASHFSGKRIVGVVNFEMVGQGDARQVRFFGGADGIAAGANPLYQRGMEQRTRGAMASLVPGHARDGGEGWFERSDHYVFARGGIPSVMYLGEPGAYHTPQDNLGAIDPKTNRAVARHALRLVAGLADDPRPQPGVGRGLPFTVQTGYQGGVYPAR